MVTTATLDSILPPVVQTALSALQSVVAAIEMVTAALLVGPGIASSVDGASVTGARSPWPPAPPGLLRWCRQGPGQ